MKTTLTCSGHFRDLTAIGDVSKPWNHMVPRGEFPGTIEIPAGYDVPGYGVAKEAIEIEGLTVLGDRELESIVQRFSGDILIDADHLSHDKSQSTEAMGWGTNIRYMPNRDLGLEVETPWTPPGREKITQQIYRYISPEFAGAVRYEDGVFKFYPVALTGAGLTNRPKLKALRPVSANRETNDTKPSMKHALTLLCGLIGSPESATEQELTDKVTAFKSDLATSRNRAKQADALETEIKGLREEAIATDLERFADVIEDKDSAKLLLQSNRDATVKFFTAALAKAQANGENKITPLYQKNRATAPDGAKFTAAGDDEVKASKAAAFVAVVKNREKCGFDAAWQIAKGEKPELFV